MVFYRSYARRQIDILKLSVPLRTVPILKNRLAFRPIVCLASEIDEVPLNVLITPLPVDKDISIFLAKSLSLSLQLKKWNLT